MIKVNLLPGAGGKSQGGSGFDFAGFEAAGLVLGLEHHVALERLADLSLEFEDGQLQQADGLLQLRRQDECLRLPDIETWAECHALRD